MIWRGRRLQGSLLCDAGGLGKLETAGKFGPIRSLCFPDMLLGVA